MTRSKSCKRPDAQHSRRSFGLQGEHMTKCATHRIQGFIILHMTSLKAAYWLRHQINTKFSYCKYRASYDNCFLEPTLYTLNIFFTLYEFSNMFWHTTHVIIHLLYNGPIESIMKTATKTPWWWTCLRIYVWRTYLAHIKLALQKSKSNICLLQGIELGQHIKLNLVIQLWK